MNRIEHAPRAGWQRKVEAEGLIWHTTAKEPYWNEGAHYSFTAEQIDTIEAATNELYRLMVEAGDVVFRKNLFHRFGIPDWCVPLITEAWNSEPPALNHGRFDLGYDGATPPKMFEFNCDTPTSLLEAAVIQWTWKEDVSDADQFNSIHDKLVAKWRDIAPSIGRTVHFAHTDDYAGEDSVTCAYLADTAALAGLTAKPIVVDDIGWDGSRFVDLQDEPIRALCKLYPWEWLVHEPFGQNVPMADTLWLEPIWKMIWSNKAILAVLWETFPNHPNLLPAHFTPRGASYAKKPLLAREGANMALVKDGVTIATTAGDYGEEGYVYQGLYDLRDFGGHRPVLGSWVVDGVAAGMGIREDGLITGNTARFVPHLIDA